MASDWRREQAAQLANIARWLREQADVLEAAGEELAARGEVKAAKRWIQERQELIAAAKGLEEDADRRAGEWFARLPEETVSAYARYRRPGARIQASRPRCPRCGGRAAESRMAGSSGDGLVSRCRKGHVWEYEGLRRAPRK